MTISWISYCCFIRRLLARISPIVRFGESSTRSTALEMRSSVTAMRCQSSVSISPLIMRSRNTRDSAASRRIESSFLLISKEKYAEGMP